MDRVACVACASEEDLMDPVAGLIDVLRREQEALDEVRYRHEVLVLLLGAGDPGWVGVAVDELERAEESLAELEMERAVRAADAAGAVGVDEAAPLREVLARLDGSAPELAALRDRLRRTSAEIDGRRQLITELAGRQLDVVRHRIDHLEANMAAATYGPR